MNAITDTFGKSKGLLMKLGIAVIVYIVLLIVVGIFAELVSDGTIDVPSAVNTSIQAVVTSMLAIGVIVFAALTTIAGFIVIAVLLAIFGPMLGINFGSSKKSGSRRKRF